MLGASASLIFRLIVWLMTPVCWILLPIVLLVTVRSYFISDGISCDVTTLDLPTSTYTTQQTVLRSIHGRLVLDINPTFRAKFEAPVFERVEFGWGASDYLATGELYNPAIISFLGFRYLTDRNSLTSGSRPPGSRLFFVVPNYFTLMLISVLPMLPLFRWLRHRRVSRVVGFPVVMQNQTSESVPAERLEAEQITTPSRSARWKRGACAFLMNFVSPVCCLLLTMDVTFFVRSYLIEDRFNLMLDGPGTRQTMEKRWTPQIYSIDGQFVVVGWPAKELDAQGQQFGWGIHGYWETGDELYDRELLTHFPITGFKYSPGRVDPESSRAAYLGFSYYAMTIVLAGIPLGCSLIFRRNRKRGVLGNR